jgi:hypothetical protein
MRANFLWFGDKVLAHCMFGFVCSYSGGDMRVEMFKGREFDASSPTSVVGFDECAHRVMRASCARRHLSRRL